MLDCTNRHVSGHKIHHSDFSTTSHNPLITEMGKHLRGAGEGVATHGRWGGYVLWSPQRVLKGTSLLCQTGEEGEGGKDRERQKKGGERKKL